MPTPSISKPIQITVTGGVKGQIITVRNRTSGDEIHTQLQDTAKCVVDLQNFANGYTAGDVIDIMVSGEKIGSGSVTTSGTTKQSVTIGTASIQTTVSRGM